MNGHDLGRLLDAAAEAAEPCAPTIEPLGALARARRLREQRRGHLAALAFVVFAVLLQVLPSEANGAARPAGQATVLAASVAPVSAPGHD